MEKGWRRTKRRNIDGERGVANNAEEYRWRKGGGDNAEEYTVDGERGVANNAEEYRWRKGVGEQCRGI